MSIEQKAQASLLSLLDRQFRARISLGDLAKSVGSGQKDTLFKKGILSVCRSEQADSGKCPLGDHPDDGIIPIQKESDGLYRGLCKEHGQIVTVPTEDAEWAEFNAIAWARTVRWINNVEGSFTENPGEIYRLGTAQHKRRRIEIAIVSTYTPANVIAHLRPSAGADLLLCVDLGNRVDASWPTAKDRVTVNAADLLQDDLLTFRDSELSRITSDIAFKPATPTKCFALKYSGANKASSLTEAQYQAETSKAIKQKLDLYIDLTQKAEAWRDGKQITKMATPKRAKKGAGKPRPLSEHCVKIIADYLKRPRVPKAPIRTEPYQDDKKRDIDSRSAQVAFDNAKKALRLESVFVLGQTVDGEREYSFQPSAGFKFVLLVKPGESIVE